MPCDDSQIALSRDHQHTITRDAEEPPTLAIIRAIAAVENVDPLDITPTLYESVDPDALNALFTRTQNQSLVVEFTLADYSIRVQHHRITVTPTASHSPTA